MTKQTPHIQEEIAIYDTILDFYNESNGPHIQNAHQRKTQFISDTIRAAFSNLNTSQSFENKANLENISRNSVILMMSLLENKDVCSDYKSTTDLTQSELKTLKSLYA